MHGHTHSISLLAMHGFCIIIKRRISTKCTVKKKHFLRLISMVFSNSILNWFPRIVTTLLLLVELKHFSFDCWTNILLRKTVNLFWKVKYFEFYSAKTVFLKTIDDTIKFSKQRKTKFGQLLTVHCCVRNKWLKFSSRAFQFKLTV
jgi:hypothetical protein